MKRLKLLVFIKCVCGSVQNGTPVTRLETIDIDGSTPETYEISVREGTAKILKSVATESNYLGSPLLLDFTPIKEFDIGN